MGVHLFCHVQVGWVCIGCACTCTWCWTFGLSSTGSHPLLWAYMEEQMIVICTQNRQSKKLCAGTIFDAPMYATFGSRSLALSSQANFHLQSGWQDSWCFLAAFAGLTGEVEPSHHPHFPPPGVPVPAPGAGLLGCPALGLTHCSGHTWRSK